MLGGMFSYGSILGTVILPFFSEICHLQLVTHSERFSTFGFVSFPVPPLGNESIDLFCFQISNTRKMSFRKSSTRHIQWSRLSSAVVNPIVQ